MEASMTSKAQARKEEILQALVKTRQNILAKVSTLSKAERQRVFLGIWSIKDLLAHLAGWDYTNVAAVGSILAGEVPSFYDYRDRDWHTYNAILVEKYKQNSFRELLASVKNSQKKLLEVLQSVPPEDFNKDFGVHFRDYKVTIQRLLESEEKDEQIHYKQIVDFFKVTE
jgi:hypothetical protein